MEYRLDDVLFPRFSCIKDSSFLFINNIDKTIKNLPCALANEFVHTICRIYFAEPLKNSIEKIIQINGKYTELFP